MTKFSHFIPAQKKSGYSLIELMVTISIVVLLSSISLAVYRQASIGARDAKRKTDLETVRQALVLRRTEVGTYPIQTAETTNAFFTVILLLRADGYLNDIEKIADPKGNVGDFGYRYVSQNGTIFTVCAEIESDGVPSATDYCVSSP